MLPSLLMIMAPENGVWASTLTANNAIPSERSRSVKQIVAFIIFIDIFSFQWVQSIVAICAFSSTSFLSLPANGQGYSNEPGEPLKIQEAKTIFSAPLFFISIALA